METASPVTEEKAMRQHSTRQREASIATRVISNNCRNTFTIVLSVAVSFIASMVVIFTRNTSVNADSVLVNTEQKPIAVAQLQGRITFEEIFKTNDPERYLDSSEMTQLELPDESILHLRVAGYKYDKKTASYEVYTLSGHSIVVRTKPVVSVGLLHPGWKEQWRAFLLDVAQDLKSNNTVYNVTVLAELGVLATRNSTGGNGRGLKQSEDYWTGVVAGQVLDPTNKIICETTGPYGCAAATAYGVANTGYNVYNHLEGNGDDHYIATDLYNYATGTNNNRVSYEYETYNSNAYNSYSGGSSYSNYYG